MDLPLFRWNCWYVLKTGAFSYLFISFLVNFNHKFVKQSKTMEEIWLQSACLWITYFFHFLSFFQFFIHVYSFFLSILILSFSSILILSFFYPCSIFITFVSIQCTPYKNMNKTTFHRSCIIVNSQTAKYS